MSGLPSDSGDLPEIFPLKMSQSKALQSLIEIAGLVIRIRQMDGGHRLAKAWLLNLKEIQAVQFEIDPEPDEIIME